MTKFGPVKYAVLVKQKDLTQNNTQDPSLQQTAAVGHKGTGFVQFKDQKVAAQVISLSRQIEEQLDRECKQQRIQNRKDGKKPESTGTKGVTGVIQAELELNGRRLVIMEAI